MADEMTIVNSDCQNWYGAGGSLGFALLSYKSTSNVPKELFLSTDLIYPVGSRVNLYDYDSDMCDSSLSDNDCLFLRAVCISLFFH